MFRRQSIQKKMIISCLVVTLIPLLILEFIFASIIHNQMYKDVVDSAAAFADQLEDNYRNELETMETIAESLETFTPLAVYLSSEFKTDADSYDYFLENLHPLLINYYETHEDLCVRIYHNEKELPNFSFQIDNHLDALWEQYLPKDAKIGDTGLWIHDRVRLNTFEAVFSYYREVREKTWPNRMLAVIAVHADEQLLYNQIANEPAESRIVFVLDKQGNILTSNLRDAVGSSVDAYPTFDGHLLTQLADGSRVRLENQEYILLQRSTEQLDIAYLVSYESIHAAQQLSMIILVAVGGLLMILASVLIVYISKGITEGINGLKKKMLNIDRESIRAIAARHLQQNTEDEVAQLESVFTGMMGQIDTLMDRIQMQERKLKDEVITRQQAEIIALQRQIDPHYLFNTLESIRMKLLIKGDREDAEIVKLFAESFRRYVDGRDEYVTLFEEVEFIRKYIFIQNYRLDNKITFECDAEERLLQYKITKLLLQPLVENAVLHGMERKLEGGKILLKIRKEEPYLEISVEDDGSGMSEAELDRLRSIVYSEQPERSVGMQNVYQRVCLVYGENAKFEIESTEGIGTIVRLLLPLKAFEGSTCFEY